MDGMTLTTKVLDPDYILSILPIDGAFDILTGELRDKWLPIKWHNLTLSFKGQNMKAARLVIRGSIHKFYNSYYGTDENVNYNHFNQAKFEKAINGLCAYLKLDHEHITVTSLEVAALAKLSADASSIIDNSILYSWKTGKPEVGRQRGVMKKFGAGTVLKVYDATRWNELYSDKYKNLTKVELRMNDLNHKGFGNSLKSVMTNIDRYYGLLMDKFNDLLIVDDINALNVCLGATMSQRLTDTMNAGINTKAARKNNHRRTLEDTRAMNNQRTKKLRIKRMVETLIVTNELDTIKNEIVLKIRNYSSDFTA